MAQLVVRNLDNSVKRRLQQRARQHGRSMEEEVREILRQSAAREVPSAGGLGSDIASLFASVGLDTDIAELRGHRLATPRFRR